MKRTDFTFELPEDQIALYPPERRDASRLLVDDGTTLHDRSFSDIAEYFGPQDILVLNNSRVRPARTHFVRSTGGLVELLWVRPLPDGKAWEVFGQTTRLKPGETLHDQYDASKTITVLHREGEYATVEPHFEAEPFLQQQAALALPPYITKRRGEQQWSADAERYQTVFSAPVGSIAAPTASLHWTPELLDAVRAKGTEILYITHHVGPGTFKPIRVDELAEHRVDPEYCEISDAVATRLRAALDAGQRITVGGTTACRALEGVYLHNGLRASYRGPIDLTILPGFKFHVTQRLITNFHVPESSLLLLVAALLGPRWRAVYDHAVQHGYRFYSYGDVGLVTTLN